MTKTTLMKSLRKTMQVTLLVVFVFFLGCDSKSTDQQVKVPKKEAIDISGFQSIENVSSVTEETRQVYQRYCAQCHGEKGHGDGINAPYLVVPPRDHTKGDYLETRSDQQLFDVIKLGGLAVGRAPCMPAWGYTFEDKTIHSLVSYIRELCDCKSL
ncbi:MAG: cytochrome c [Nitrospina sp.]|nr:cytochrome c [Nitrospina sp.]MBT6601929.1 cytochrome c [Nitrospina sp.]